jgi:hypothetical protein
MVMEAAKQYEKKRANENIEKLERLRAARQAELANSRWQRAMLFIEDHPLRVAFVAVFVMVSVMVCVFVGMRVKDQAAVAQRDAARAPMRKVPKLSEEKRAKIQDLFDRKKKMKGKGPDDL